MLGDENEKFERNEKKGNKLAENEDFKCVLGTAADESLRLKNKKWKESI